jgi:hypothetical protein
MKKIIAAAFALTILGAGAADAAISIRVGGPVHHRIIRHHRHQVCEWRHHHRVCFWR